jgi:hypothetical protein
VPTHRLLSLAVLTAALALPASAHAAPKLLLDATTALDAPLTANPGEAAGACHRAYRPRAAGVAARDARLSGAGSLEVRLDGDEGDWDVAVFDAAGNVLAADASPDAQEVASGFALKGGVVRVQACRRAGDAASVPATLEHSAIAPGAAEAAAKADPPQLVNVITPTRAQRQQLIELDLDMTEHGGAESLGVVLHGAEDEAALRKAGLRWVVVVGDLVAEDRAARLSERRAAAAAASRGSATASGVRARATALPSGRTTYRTLADYNAELKDLAAKNPNLVKLFTMPEKTYGGKDVLGIEITENVGRNDGKPAFFNMGVHHAREWPSGELAMEWAIELVNGYKKGDARATRVVRNARNIVVPIVNPDGFEASRTAGELAGQAGGRDETAPDTAYLVAGAATGGEYRRKNCRLPDDSAAGNCTTSVGLAENGVDPNRNYGGLWGGPGADSNPLTQTYRGPEPFSEPETRNIRSVVSRNQVVTLITNHTTAGLVLRAPGLQALGDPVDENKGYKALGDAMAKENGYFSQKSFELYDTTGTTEDWSYNATGGFGFTFEIYCGRLEYSTGDCGDPAFHPRYQRVVEEWDGTNPVADHAQDPGPDKGYDGKGNREAYYIAAESTLDEQRHSVLEASVPPGTTLRLKKQFKTQTFPQDQADGSEKPIEFDDTLETTYDVGETGRARWHVNPSTRPIVAKSSGAQNPGPSSPPEAERGGSPAGTPDDPSDDGQATPFPEPTNGANSNDPTHYNEHPITIPASGDNGSMTAKVEWASPTSDWDVRLYEDANGNGKGDDGEKVVSKSQTGLGSGSGVSEEVTIAGQPRLAPGAKYVLRVNNFSATEPYTLNISYAQPLPFKPGQTESYTLTCERNGTVYETQQVVVERGEVKRLDLRACAAAVQRACAANTIGLRSVKATRKGSGMRFGFRRFARRKVQIDVFQVSRGDRVIDERLVKRFKARSKAVTWNGRGARGDGLYFARYRMRTRNGKGREVRRVTLLRRNGRFSRRPDFYRRATCDLLPSYKLERAAFGGRSRTPLRIAFRVATPARAQVTVLRGKKVVKRFKARTRAPKRTHRLRVSSRRLAARGDYRVRIVVGRGAGRVTSTLVSRRL